ncbi:hypothetical protein GLOTRDRAFT_72623 [Gloeophyllum trabeum ATCC 11539]|uniref:Late embryogenesis abundant protein LEA-2 subgroup domain-containing protein n=1 Tax=Gloeophyllum trabeum (strain ATCC 11539 / FP-39264 / Madison 617) TaxID=670483 RepID=S7QGJ6_GLOTA|nr:uncharacterized protein GLOTRDRAFT_72623 [Gloeophyllum trabeum ATCC 11539]EPQ58313.1 hypothetical protein GLOTRDRAFT_72623 [Gloeophyllum trabeum ATCC 11539]
MATYNDPYARSYGGQTQPYSHDNFNPYENRAPHETYDQGAYGPYVGGYRDEPFRPPDQLQGRSKETSTFDEDDANGPKRRLTKTSRTIRALKYDDDNLWTRGGRGRCIGRFCCCSLLIALFLVVSIILSLLLWIRPPSIDILNVGAPTTGSEIQFTNDGTLNINLAVNITVNNPNYFSVDFKQIKAQIFYPINNTAIGGGQENNIVFDAGKTTNFTFPFTIAYKASDDPTQAVLSDIAQKCGFGGGAKSNLVVDYKLTLGLRTLAVTVSPIISNQFSFACPLSQSDIEQILKNGGISGLPGLSGLVTGH